MGSLVEDWRQCARRPEDNWAWQNLLDCHKGLFGRIAGRVANRFGLGRSSEVEDAIQEVCLKMSAQARAGGVPDGDDAGVDLYLRSMAANAAHDYFRQRRARRRDMLATVSIDQVSNLHGSADDLETAILLKQLEKLAGVSERDRSVFALYYRQGWKAREIASIPSLKLNTKGVESLIYRLTERLRMNFKKGKAEDPRIQS